MFQVFFYFNYFFSAKIGDRGAKKWWGRGPTSPSPSTVPDPKRWNRGTVEAGNPDSRDDSLDGVNLTTAMMERGNEGMTKRREKNSKSLKMESRNGGKFSKILKEGIKERQNSGFPKRQNNGKSPEILLIKDPRNDGKSAVIKRSTQSCQRGREYLKERKE